MRALSIIFVLVSAIVIASAVAYGYEVGIVNNPDGEYLAMFEGKVQNETSVLRELTDFEWAFLSPGGGRYAVLEIEEGYFPVKSSVSVFDRNGSLLYTVADSEASFMHVSDTGASVLVTYFGMGPSSAAKLEIYNASGYKTGAIDTAFVGDCVFYPDNDLFAISVKGESTRVVDISEGEEKYRLPYSKTFIAGENERLLLIDREWMAFYDAETEIWRIPHDLYFPRMAEIKNDGYEVLIGCHHEVANVNLNEGEISAVWEAPGDFGLTDLDASGDFSLITVGLRTLDGVESVYLLDSDFGTIKSREETVAAPRADTPAVTVIEGFPNKAHIIGQGWEAELYE